MPDKKSPDAKASAEPEEGGPKKLIMTIGICVVLLAVGYVLGGKMAGGAPAEAGAAAEAGGEAEEPELHVGELVALDALNVNLAEGRYLRLALTLGLNEEIELVDSHGKPIEFPTAAAVDLLLSTFSGLEMEELTTPEGREHVREKLMHSYEEEFGEDIVAVYFTEFVMQ